MAKAPTGTAAAVASLSEDSSCASKTTMISKDLTLESADMVMECLTDSESSPQNSNRHDLNSDILRHVLKADLVQRGRVSCHFSVLPLLTNFYNGMHGGAVASIAERVAIACARTVVVENKQLFLGELSISYLSAALRNENLVVSGSVVRSGRNLTVVAIEFKIKETGKLVYTARATFYHMPIMAKI